MFSLFLLTLICCLPDVPRDSVLRALRPPDVGVFFGEYKASISSQWEQRLWILGAGVLSFMEGWGCEWTKKGSKDGKTGDPEETLN